MFHAREVWEYANRNGRQYTTKDKRKSQCTAPDKMLLFCVKIIVVASIVAALGQMMMMTMTMKKKKKKEIQFSTHVDFCSSRKLCINVLSIFDHKSNW